MNSFQAASPPLSAAVTQMFNTLESAAEQMMVHRDFQAAFDTCLSGLESLAGLEPEDSRWGSWSFTHMFNWKLGFLCYNRNICSCRCAELKAGFCILGIQALAELNQWRDVLCWVLQQYEQEKIPAKIMQMWWGKSFIVIIIIITHWSIDPQPLGRWTQYETKYKIQIVLQFKYANSPRHVFSISTFDPSLII